MVQVAVICSRHADSGDAGYSLLVEHLTGPDRVSETFYTIVRHPAELFLRDFSNYAAILVHGAASGRWLPFLKSCCGTKIVLHLSRIADHGRFSLGRWLEKRAVESADILVADNKAIADYLHDSYGRKVEVIAYGGDHFRKKFSSVLEEDFLSGCHLRSGSYALAVSRIAPENNCSAILEAFSLSLEPLIFIGDWDNGGDYAMKLKRKFGSLPNVFLLNKDDTSDMVYMAMKHCRMFICGHSAEGTDPVLVGAMSLGKPVLCYDTKANRYATRDMAHYFRTVQDVMKLIFVGVSNGETMAVIAKNMYDWKYIDKKYKGLYER